MQLNEISIPSLDKNEISFKVTGRFLSSICLLMIAEMQVKEGKRIP